MSEPHPGSFAGGFVPPAGYYRSLGERADVQGGESREASPEDVPAPRGHLGQSVAPAKRFRMKDRPDIECVFAGYNYHGVGEFIAIFAEGDASSEFCRDWEPIEGRWPDER